MRRLGPLSSLAAGLGALTLLGSCGGPPRHPVAPGPATLYSQRPALQGIDARVLRGRRILLDPGHGGRFGGAEGVANTREADVNLGVALYLWGLLHDAGAEVALTRSSDRDLLEPGETAVRDDLAARVAQIEALRPDVFLSLHHNSNTALDRERNAIETYYKLDDDGPSYDLGRAIQSRLAAALGIDVARLLPGNYFVLRGATGAAVLGEASYLSNPKVETALQLAAKQQLEAEAYFLGLIDYFAHGVAAVEREAASDTVALGAPVIFKTALPFEPATVAVRVDGVTVPVEIDAQGARFAVLADWMPGVHSVEAQTRLVLGNAAHAWRGRLVAYMPPAQAVLTAQPARAGARTRVGARVLDTRGRPVSDGVPVRWESAGARILDADSTAIAGEAIAWVQTTSPRPQIAITAGLAHDTVTIPVVPDPGTAGIWRCIDARSGRAVEGAWSAGARSDRRGLLDALRADSVQVQRRGYERWRGAAPLDGILLLQPLRAAAFLDVPVVVDPAGAGGEAALQGLGFAAGDLTSELARMLSGTLDALGAQAAVTRGAADTVTDLDRVRVAMRTGARWFLRIEVTGASSASVAYYPGSEAGMAAAQALRDALGARGFATGPVRSETHFILQQTPCPAVWVQFPASRVATLDGRRNAVAALTAGLHQVLDPAAGALPPFVGRVAPARGGVAVLDGAETAPLVRGIFRFEHVTPGEHWLALLDSTRVELPVRVTGTDTLQINPRH